MIQPHRARPSFISVVVVVVVLVWLALVAVGLTLTTISLVWGGQLLG